MMKRKIDNHPAFAKTSEMYNETYHRILLSKTYNPTLIPKKEVGKIQVEIVEDFIENGELSPKSIQKITEWNLDINKIKTHLNTNLLGECYHPYSVNYLERIGLRLEDETGRIGVWCPDSILEILVQKDMNFKPCIEYLKGIIEKSNKLEHKQRLEKILSLIANRKAAIKKIVADVVYDDIGTCVISFL